MIIEDLDYNEDFWIALSKAVASREGFHVNPQSNERGHISYKRETIAYFDCSCDNPPKVRVIKKKYFDLVKDIMADVEDRLLKKNLSHFKQEVHLKKDWGVKDII